MGHDVHSVFNMHPVKEGKPQRLDLNDPEGITRCIQEKAPDAVIHTASMTDVDLCEANPELAMRVNGQSTGLLARECHDGGSFLAYVSTDYVFDGKQGKYNENDEPNPINVYGHSKLLGEHEVVRYHKNSCIARTSVLYGWGREHRPNFATWLYEKLRAGQKTEVVVDQFASPTFNSQLARSLLEVVERRLQGVLHLAGSSRVSRYEFAVQLAREFGFNEKLLDRVNSESTSWKAKRPFDSSLNVSKAMERLSNKPVTLTEALSEMAQEVRAK